MCEEVLENIEDYIEEMHEGGEAWTIYKWGPYVVKQYYEDDLVGDGFMKDREELCKLHPDSPLVDFDILKEDEDGRITLIQKYVDGFSIEDVNYEWFYGPFFNALRKDVQDKYDITDCHSHNVIFENFRDYYIIDFCLG